MMKIAGMTFQHPWVLLLLPLAALALWWWRHTLAQRSLKVRMPSLESVQNLQTWRTHLRRHLHWLRVAALALLVIALARPQLRLQEEKITSDGIDIALSIDLSSSMLAQDFKPNRLEVSKLVAIDFVDKRPFDRIAVVVFAGESFTQCPLTADHNLVKNFIGALQCGALTDGTAIGQGLATAVNRLKDSKAKSKVIILLTDGVNNAGYIAPNLAAQLAQKFGIKVYTIGVGSEGEALAPIGMDALGRFRYDLTQVVIDEELLRGIAQATGGRYFRATSAEKLQEIYALIDELEKTPIETTVIRRNKEYFRFFALPALCLVLLEMLLRYAVLRGID